MGGARRDDHPDNIQATHLWCNEEKGRTGWTGDGPSLGLRERPPNSRLPLTDCVPAVCRILELTQNTSNAPMIANPLNWRAMGRTLSDSPKGVAFRDCLLPLLMHVA
jgi:hypothetical protein